MPDIKEQIRTTIWAMIEPIVNGEGFSLFDLNMPTSRTGTLRIFISNAPKGKATPKDETKVDDIKVVGVGVEDCARITRKISPLLEKPELGADEWTLEVSSPGVNRKLTRPEHFEGALGERVKLTVERQDSSTSKSELILGILHAFDGAKLQVEDENSHKLREVVLQAVKEARTDFLFR